MAAVNETTKLERNFDAALAAWESTYLGGFTLDHREAEAAEKATRKALFAAWWFIENCSAGAPGTTDVFFRVRELVRTAQ